MTTTKNPVSAFFLAIALAGCSSPSPQTSSSSNWVVCSVDAECAARSSAFKCEDGYCVDSKNGRVVNESGDGDTSTAVSAASKPPPLDAGSFLGGTSVGVLIAISGSLMKGNYEIVGNLSAGEGFVWSWETSSSEGRVEVDVVGTEPAPGVTVQSPNVRVTLYFATADDGIYPANGHGHCSFTGVSGESEEAHGRFACEDLVGIGSGQPFSLSGAVDGVPPTPPLP